MTSRVCPKCGYVRKPTDTAPDWQCPSCGVAYAKVGTEPHHPPPRPTSNSYVVPGIALVIVSMIAYGFYATLARSSSGLHARKAEGTVATQARAKEAVIMYSLSDCGYCVQKRKELHAAGIPFVEYFIDLEPARLEEWNNKVASLGFTDGTFIGTPTFDVNGTILPNNPPLEEIRRHL